MKVTFYSIVVQCIFLVITCDAIKPWQSPFFGSGRSFPLAMLFSGGDISRESTSTTPKEEDATTKPIIMKQTWKFTRFEEVKSEIEESESIEEALDAAEEIPAIQKSADRAMKIMSADTEDAILALRVLFKISNFIAAASLQNGISREDLHINELSVSHRIEHVADCVSLNLRFLNPEDLIVAAWSLNTIKLDNQVYIEAVMNEYGNRMVDFWSDKSTNATPRLRIDDIAAMIWTIGAHRDQYGWSNITLINELVNAFAVYNGTATQSFAQLDPRMNIRILWAMSLFNILRHHQDFATQGVSNILPYLAELTPTNKVSTLWCVARARLTNASIVVPVIETVNQLILAQPDSLRDHEVNYVLQAAKIMNERMRRLLMDHKCNLTAVGMAKSHLGLDEAMILNATEKLLRSIVIQALPSLEQQSFQNNLNILRVLGRMELLDEDQAAFKAYYDRFREKVEIALAANISSPSSSLKNIPFISPTDAADILEMIATTVEYPGLLQGELANIHLRDDSRHAPALETGQVVAVEEKTRLPKAISSSVGVSNMIQLSSVSSHHWHELMGKLGVYISCYRKEISDRATFVHAAWALARMGHALKPLCRKARTYAEHQQLTELPIQVLSRLVVVLASEQASLINNAASVKSPVSYELIGRVSTTVLTRLHEVTLLSDLSQIVFSVAFLGRLPHYNKAVAAEALAQLQQQQKQNHNDEEQDKTSTTPKTSPTSSSNAFPLQKQISLRPLQLMFLSTEEIIGLYWSTRQLAADNNLHIFEGETMQRLIQEVQRRLPVYLVSPTESANAASFQQNKNSNKDNEKSSDVTAQTPSSASPSSQSQSPPTTINFKDSFLLVKSLSNSADVRDSSLDPLKDQACALLMQQCAQLFQAEPTAGKFDRAPLSDRNGILDSAEARENAVEKDQKSGWYRAEQDQASMLSAADVQMIGGIMRDDLAGYQPLDQALEMHVSVLIDAIQAFIDLRWYKEDMITTGEVALSRMRQVLQNHHISASAAAASAAAAESVPPMPQVQQQQQQRGLRLADSHVLHFQYGVLSQLLNLYRELPMLLAANEEVPVGKMPAKKKSSAMLMAHFPRLHGLFSRFLGTVPESVAGAHPAPAVIAPVAPGSAIPASTRNNFPHHGLHQQQQQQQQQSQTQQRTTAKSADTSSSASISPTSPISSPKTASSSSGSQQTASSSTNTASSTAHAAHSSAATAAASAVAGSDGKKTVVEDDDDDIVTENSDI